MRAWMATPRFDPLSLINRNRGIFGLHIGHLWEERRQLAPLIDLLLQRAHSRADRRRSWRERSRSITSPTRTGSFRAGEISAKSC